MNIWRRQGMSYTKVLRFSSQHISTVLRYFLLLGISHLLLHICMCVYIIHNFWIQSVKDSCIVNSALCSWIAHCHITRAKEPYDYRYILSKTIRTRGYSRDGTTRGVGVKGWKDGRYFIFMGICRYCARCAAVTVTEN